MMTTQCITTTNRNNKLSSPDADANAKATSRTYCDLAATPPKCLSDGEKIAQLVQLNMDGLPISNCSLVVVRLPFIWNGSNGGKNSISRVCIQQLHNLWEAIFKIQHKFKILPVHDSKFRNKKHWITNKASMKVLAGQWHQVKNYADLSFGNGEWISSLAFSTGSKTFTTRFRVASDDTEEGVIATISSLLADSNGKCLKSPIQFCPAARTGSFPFYPLYIKLLDCKGAVGIDIDWMSIPSDRNRNTWKPGSSGRSNGIRLLHVWTKEADAKLADCTLRQHFRPSTPKRDFPYGAVTQYVHDWKSVQKKQLSVGPYRPVRDLVTTMAQKAVDFDSVTETFCLPLPIPGMLKIVETKKCGAISLLRFLLLIVATPAQAAQASKEAPAGENSGEDEGDEDDDDGEEEAVQLPGASEGFNQVVDKKSKKRQQAEERKQVQLAKAAEQALYKNRRPGEDEAINRTEMVQKKDMANLDPGILFQLITPEQTTGYYLFTSRNKFVSLALNMANGLPAFIAYHLEESDPSRESEIIRKWLGATELSSLRRRNLVWDQDLMCSRPATDHRSSTVDNNMDWLEFGRDILDQTAGFLAIDMEMADVRDFDDGATVAGALEDRLDQMSQEVTFYGDENARLEREKAAIEQEKAALAARVKELEAQQADDLRVTRSQRSGKSTRADRGGGSSMTAP